MKTTPLNGYRIPSTIRYNGPSLYGHWDLPELKPLRDQAREWARAQDYYENN